MLGRHIGYILLIALAFIAITTAKPVKAATVKTNVKGVVKIQEGKTKKLHVKGVGKVTWKSSKKSVATVSKSGKITAKKPGTAKITAKAGKKTWTCTIKVTKKAKAQTKAKAKTKAESGSAAAAEAAVEYRLDTSGMNAEDAAIFKQMYAMKDLYPEGRTWTNDNYYKWNGGIFRGGYGCSGFAFILSDQAFGDTPARRHTDWNDVKTGDIIRIDNNTHSVMVMKVVDDNFIVAEGNYNSSIHWGRVISREEARANGTYVMTRR